ncbi:hypothetical protein CRP_176 [Candidatus Carsonella ruddii PV]|uniref:Argininosuccinate lyase n=1 Tax=Carsonella ruddii (strain PV) TaxID=387662 RepID=Q05FG4_CARRP|nr:hypothetical protein [Candidatus Carsonella ruddii]BAF35207.1 hypothetical protein CRP_176 [Candidatus Carsonella ruddii PV]
MNFIQKKKFQKKIIYKNDFFLVYYKFKFFYAKIKCLFYLNLINVKQKKKFLNLITYCKKKNINIFKKIYFFDKKIIFQLFLLDEIDKIHILIIFIRKILINLSELEYKTIFYKNEIKNFTTIGHLYLYWNNLLSIDCNLLLNLKLLTSILPSNIFNFIEINKNKLLVLIKNLLDFKSINENVLNKNYDYYLSFTFFLISINTHLISFFEEINYLFLEYKNAIFIFLNSNFFFFYNLFKSDSLKIDNNIKNIINSLKNFEIIKPIIIESIYLIKSNLNLFRKIISSIKIKKKKFYLLNFKKEKIFKKIKKYLISKKIKSIDCNIIIKKINNYITIKNINLYNISFYELNKINKNIKKDFFEKISLENKFKKNNFYGSDNYKQILKSIQRAKFALNKTLIKFKI